PAGGTPDYSFVWSNGDTVQAISGLASGVYTVTITDLNGCVKVDSSYLDQPSPLYTSGIIKNVSCFGSCDGAVFTTPYGGTVPYTFAWSTGPDDFNYQLCPGNYYL